MTDIEIKEVKDNIQLFDFVYIISSNNNINPKIEKILDITKDYIYTKNYKFLKSNLRCIIKNNEHFKIKDYIPNYKFRITNFLEKKNYKIISDTVERRVFNKIYKNLDIMIYLNLNKNNLKNKLIIKINEVYVFNGLINSIESLNIIYESTIKYLYNDK